jgi:HSP20 family protein
MLNLIPWRRNRAAEVSPVQHEVNRLFEDFFRLPDIWREWERAHESGFMPAVDVRETEKAVIVEAELPGIDPKAIDIAIENCTLHLRGERSREEERESPGGVRRIERSYGRFERYLPLPDSIDRDAVEATCKDGVVTITIGKRPETTPRTIAVKAA